jgi:hypothetical protein
MFLKETQRGKAATKKLSPKYFLKYSKYDKVAKIYKKKTREEG